MAKIDSGATVDQWTIDPISKAGRVTLYDSRGNPVGQKITYSAGTASRTNTFASTGVFLAIYGSATKTIRVQRVVITATQATAVGYNDCLCAWRSVAVTGGTATALTKVPHDSGSAAATANLVSIYTALPTPGTGGGIIACQTQFVPLTSSVIYNAAMYDFDWRIRDEAEAPVLRGIAQGLEFNIASAPAGIPAVIAQITWTEE